MKMPRRRIIAEIAGHFKNSICEIRVSIQRKTFCVFGIGKNEFLGIFAGANQNRRTRREQCQQLFVVDDAIIARRGLNHFYCRGGCDKIFRHERLRRHHVARGERLRAKQSIIFWGNDFIRF